MVEDRAHKGVVFFKSASRDEYRGKILTALSLPEGFHLHTWYDQEWVSEDLWSEINRSRNKLSKIDSCLIFVDMVAKPPRFYPLRKCTIYKTYVRDERVYFWLKIGEYYKYDEDTLEEFNKKLKDMFEELPGERHSFAQFGDVSKICSGFGSSAGLEAMEKLAKSLVEKCNQNFQKSVFYKFDLYETGNKKVPKVKEIDKEPHIVLKEGKWYHIYFDYYIPDPEQFAKQGGPEVVKVVFSFNDEHFYAPTKTLLIPCTTRIYGRRIDFQSKSAGKPEIVIEREDDLHNAPNPLIKVRIYGSFRSILWAGLFFAGLLITALPQIYEVPTEIAFLKTILSLIAGPFISTLAIWLMKRKG